LKKNLKRKEKIFQINLAFLKKPARIDYKLLKNTKRRLFKAPQTAAWKALNFLSSFPSLQPPARRYSSRTWGKPRGSA
jgi:hypothetical protein